MTVESDQPIKTQPGPTYRDCESCHTHPAVGVSTGNDNYWFAHLCHKCGPGAPNFEEYAKPGDDDR